MVKWAYEVAELVAKPPKRFYTIPVRNARKVVLADGEYEAVLVELGRSNIRHPTPYLRPPFEFACLTGWRSGEIKGLMWDMVDWTAGYIHLPGTITKNGEPRRFPFHCYPPLRALLQRQWTAAEELRRVHRKTIPWIFPGPAGDQIKDWWKGWRSAVIRAATMEINGQRVVRPSSLGSMVRVDADGTVRHDRKPHDFRRTARRQMRRAGVPEETIMALCGWKTREMLDHYDVETNQDLEDGVGKLARQFGGNSPVPSPALKQAAS
jgi:integrase